MLRHLSLLATGGGSTFYFIPDNLQVGDLMSTRKESIPPPPPAPNLIREVSNWTPQPMDKGKSDRAFPESVPKSDSSIMEGRGSPQKESIPSPPPAPNFIRVVSSWISQPRHEKKSRRVLSKNSGGKSAGPALRLTSFLRRLIKLVRGFFHHRLKKSSAYSP